MDQVSHTDEKNDVQVHLTHVEEIAKEHGDEDEVAAEAIGGTNDDLPKGYYRSASFIGTVTALALGSISCYLGFVLPANTLTLINESIGPDPAYTWVALVWTLTESLAFVLVGRLGDLLGRRWFFVGGNLIGLIGTIVGGTAKNIPTLIVGNALTGIAAAVQLSFAVVISELLPNKWRGYGVSTMFCASAPVAAFGPVIARAFITRTSQGWRWSYYLNIIVSGLTVILFYCFYHPPTYNMLHTKHSKKDIFKMLDLGGSVLFIAGLVVFLIGISWGGGVAPWTSARVLGCIIGGAAILACFILYEIYIAKEFPLIPMKLFYNRQYVGVMLTAAIGSCVYYAMNIIWPIQISVFYETDIMLIGWLSCTIGAGALIGQCFCGILVKRLGKQKWQLVVMMIVLVCFTVSMAAATPSTKAMGIIFTLIASIALGYVENVAFTIAPFSLPPGDIGLALGLLGCVRSSVATVAEAVFVTVLDNGLVKNIPKYVIPAAESAGLPASSIPDLLTAFTTGVFTNVKGITPQIIAAAAGANQTAYVQSFKIVYLAAIPWGVVGIIAALNAPNAEKHFDEFISRRLHGRDLSKKSEVISSVEKV